MGKREKIRRLEAIRTNISESSLALRAIEDSWSWVRKVKLCALYLCRAKEEMDRIIAKCKRSKVR